MIIIFFLNSPTGFASSHTHTRVREVRCPGFVSVAAEYDITSGLRERPCVVMRFHIYIYIMTMSENDLAISWYTL